MEEAGWAGPLPLLPLPCPFLVIVYLTLPAHKSIHYLSKCPEGQQMKLPVTAPEAWAKALSIPLGPGRVDISCSC